MARVKDSTKRDPPPQNSFAQLESRNIFTHPEVFNSDYIPEHILFRREFDDVIRLYFQCVKFKLQQALIIIGPTGSGKTLAARYYGKNAKVYADQNDVRCGPRSSRSNESWSTA